MPRRFLTLAAALVCACATAPSGGGSAPLRGSYRLAEINGQVVPALSPTEAGVTIESGDLRLSDNRYTLQLKARVGGQAPGMGTGPWLHGVFAVSGDSLSFTPDRDSDGDPVTFRFTVRGAELALRDPSGAVYLFRRGVNVPTR